MFDFKAQRSSLLALIGFEVLCVAIGFSMATTSTGAAIVILLMALPIALACAGGLAGWYAHPVWLHPLVVAIITAIMVLSVANSSALVYISYFIAANVMGFLIGFLARRTLNARDGNSGTNLK